jgi:hypothetical protein
MWGFAGMRVGAFFTPGRTENHRREPEDEFPFSQFGVAFAAFSEDCCDRFTSLREGFDEREY